MVRLCGCWDVVNVLCMWGGLTFGDQAVDCSGFSGGHPPKDMSI